jgi:hypothetical protein
MLGDHSTLSYVYSFRSNHCIFQKSKRRERFIGNIIQLLDHRRKTYFLLEHPLHQQTSLSQDLFGPKLSSLESIGGRYYKISYHSICVNLAFAALPSSPSSASRPNNPPPPGVNHSQWIMALLHHKRLFYLRLLPLQHRAFQFRSRAVSLELQG